MHNSRCPSITASILFAFLASIVASAESVSEQKAIALSSHPQLFLDDYLVAKSHNIRRVLNQPEKHPGNPLPLVPEYPWEQARMDSGTVHYDTERKTFRMWYTVLMDKKRYSDNFGYVCYAESEDGIHWRKPLMEIHEFEGQSPTNIVFKGPSRPEAECLFPSVINTPNDPARPYKMLFTHRQRPEDRSHHGLNVSTSEDGIHWTEPRLIYEGKCDNPPSLIWSPPLKKYFGYCRAQDSHEAMVGHIRSTGILESLDFDHWTPRKKVVLTDEREGYPFVQFHHVMVTQYGDLMIGLADVMHILRDDNKTSTEDVQLICSRDGWNWDRVADRAVFIANGPEAYDQEIAAPRSPIVRVEDLLYFYYQGSSRGQRPAGPPWPKTRQKEGGICLATLPADRFVVIEQEYPGSPAFLETRSFTTSAQNLLLNAEIASRDDIEIELLDESGAVLEGFNKENSNLLVHDPLRYTVVWEDNNQELTLGDATSDQAVACRFIIHDGALFAFQTAD